MCCRLWSCQYIPLYHLVGFISGDIISLARPQSRGISAKSLALIKLCGLANSKCCSSPMVAAVLLLRLLLGSPLLLLSTHPLNVQFEAIGLPRG